MSFNVFITENFKKEFKVLFKKYQSLKEDVSELTSSLETNPTQGVPLGKDCFKLLSIYDKSQKETISTKELEALIKSAVC